MLPKSSTVSNVSLLISRSTTDKWKLAKRTQILKHMKTKEDKHRDIKKTVFQVIEHAPWTLGGDQSGNLVLFGQEASRQQANLCTRNAEKWASGGSAAQGPKEHAQVLQTFKQELLVYFLRHRHPSEFSETWTIRYMRKNETINWSTLRCPSCVSTCIFLPDPQHNMTGMDITVKDIFFFL